MNPSDCKYTKGHTWVRASGNEATIGITDYAQGRLGHILFLELRQPGDDLQQGQPCGTVESDKATADIMCPASGKVSAVNQKSQDAPEVVNRDPYGEGWLLKIRLSNPRELDSLMTADQFEAYIAGS